MKTLKKLRDCRNSVDFMNVVVSCGLLAEFVMGFLLLLKQLKHTTEIIVMTEANILWIMGVIAELTASTLVIFIIAAVIYEVVIGVKFVTLDKIKTHIKDEISKLNSLDKLLSEYGDEETKPVKKEITKREIEKLTNITLDEPSAKATTDIIRMIRRSFKDFVCYIDEAVGYMIDNEFNDTQIAEKSADIVVALNKCLPAYDAKHIMHTAGADYETVMHNMLIKDIRKLNNILLD